MSENFKYLKSLREIYFISNYKCKIGNEIGDEVMNALFINAKYLKNFERLFFYDGFGKYVEK